MSWRRERGFTLVEMLVGLVLVLIFAAAVAGFLAGAARLAVTYPLAADERQRARAVLDQVAGWIAGAGQGLGGSGQNAGWLLVPALYPQRRGVATPDADDAAYADRLTVVSAIDPAVGGRLGAPMSSATAPISVDPASCGPGLIACGLTSGMTTLIADARGNGEWFSASAVAGTLVNHAPAALSAAYSDAAGSTVQGVEVRAIVLDGPRRQLRVAMPESDLPLVDGVSGFLVRWIGEQRPPAGPIPPVGEANCVVDGGGAPTLPSLSGAGPWVELSSAQMSDGPWCGAAPWRFDADLLRVRMVTLMLRMERAPVAGAAPVMGIHIAVAPRNLRRLRTAP